MKAIMGFTSWVLLSFSLNGASPIKIIGYDRAGTLVWSNLLCTSTPVYEVLRADSVTGPWQHVAYVTNDSSYTLANLVPPQSSAAFYQIAWIKDTPITFNYIFEECYDTGFDCIPTGYPSVFGTLTFDIPGGVAQWSFEETDFNTSDHPLGDGRGPLFFDSVDQLWIVVLEPLGGDAGKFLAGELQFSRDGVGCGYTYDGAAYRNTIAGPGPMGYFAASQQ